jgi:hypothetical protein
MDENEDEDEVSFSHLHLLCSIPCPVSADYAVPSITTDDTARQGRNQNQWTSAAKERKGRKDGER